MTILFSGSSKYNSFNLCKSNSVFPVPANPWIDISLLCDGLNINLVWSPSNKIIFCLTLSSIFVGASSPIFSTELILPISNEMIIFTSLLSCSSTNLYFSIFLTSKSLMFVSSTNFFCHLRFLPILFLKSYVIDILSISSTISST